MSTVAAFHFGILLACTEQAVTEKPAALMNSTVSRSTPFCARYTKPSTRSATVNSLSRLQKLAAIFHPLRL
jgi:hypothetical protein